MSDTITPRDEDLERLHERLDEQDRQISDLSKAVSSLSKAIRIMSATKQDRPGQELQAALTALPTGMITPNAAPSGG